MLSVVTTALVVKSMGFVPSFPKDPSVLTSSSVYQDSSGSGSTFVTSTVVSVESQFPTPR